MLVHCALWSALCGLDLVVLAGHHFRDRKVIWLLEESVRGSTEDREETITFAMSPSRVVTGILRVNCPSFDARHWAGKWTCLPPCHVCRASCLDIEPGRTRRPIVSPSLVSDRA